MVHSGLHCAGAAGASRQQLERWRSEGEEQVAPPFLHEGKLEEDHLLAIHEA